LTQLIWCEHPAFVRECKPFIKKYPSFKSRLEIQGKKLIERQLSESPLITSNLVLRVTRDSYGQWEMMKLKLYVKELKRPGQWPRIWYAITPTQCIFLTIASHVDNYHDNEMNNIALQRLRAFLTNNP
jgi:hypothetical protein